ncbi:uncharacterized protein LOC123716041 isoform X2 [Pieris brassicae]|uniref:uncharacterized protein LOC123716041 isoform X2 n=1 Tax=Pieris brassicae TaxID=7116 RepID=UPI001E65FAC2|nr:uncharacterized protein LOC123716041 isoform X2 [Pieris brassicae]
MNKKLKAKFVRYIVQCWLDSGIYTGLSQIFEPKMYGWYPMDWTARRQALTHPLHTQSVTTRKKKKVRQKSDPHYGYEPYWEGYGKKLEEKKKETGENFACGEECHLMFVEYGEVCGRGKNYTHKTFENYCQLLNHDCSGREKWMIAYRGPCQNDTLKTYPTKRADFIDRAKKYQSEFYRKNPTTVKFALTKTLPYRTFTKRS